MLPALHAYLALSAEGKERQGVLRKERDARRANSASNKNAEIATSEIATSEIATSEIAASEIATSEMKPPR
jgi:hypothetical protein